MKAVLIFDNVNDLVFSQWDDTFIERMKSLGQQEIEGTLSDNDAYNVSQLFSPIITSQRVMAAQFGNTYSSMQCKDGVNLAFDEWLDHILLLVGPETIEDLHRDLLDLKTLIQHICGHNFHLLHSPLYKEWLSVLLLNARLGDHIPGASGTVGESGASMTSLNALKSTAARLKAQRFHIMLYVGDKLLTLYSSRGAVDLTPADLILLRVQCITAQEFWDKMAPETTQDGVTRPAVALRVPWLSEENSAIVNLCAGNQFLPSAPHSMHIAPVAPRVTVAVIFDMELREIGVAASTSMQILSNLRRVLLQRNIESVPPILESLENSVRKTTESLRRNKSHASLSTRLGSRLLELSRACTTTTPLTPETAAASLHTALEAVTELLRPDVPQLSLCDVSRELRRTLAPYVDFLRVKASRCFSLGSPRQTCSITRNKYVDEFPGLVHFVLTDRTAQRYIAPDRADCEELLDPEKLRAHLTRGLRFVREGYTAATWRSGGLHACLVLWWERDGAAVSPRPAHPAALRALPPPGDILNAFYRQLTELCFPGDTSVAAKELLCIHLGLLPAASAVEQARRLARTVHDEDGTYCSNPADLL